MSSNSKPIPKNIKTGFLIFFVVAIIAVGGGYLNQRHKLSQEADERAAELAKGPKVKVAKAIPSPTERVLQIPGEARAYSSVTLYAKVSGYLKTIKVDKGDRVKKGQVLAVIESPETEQAYQGAASEAKNKKAIAERIRSLLDRQLVSQQEADQAFADSEMAVARLNSAVAQRDYQTIRAPFDGTVTARFADPGALVQNATNAQTGALPLISISQLDQLRVFAYIDQRDVSFVKVGSEAEVALSERPEVVFKGHVSRISGQLDDKTRMLLTEIDLDNDQGQIVAGSLVNVSMHLTAPAGIDVPSDAIILQNGKSVVGIVSNDNIVNYSEVKILDNSGERAKITSGLEAGQLVILGAGNSIPAQSKVRPLQDEAKPAAQPAAGNKAAENSAPGASKAAATEVKK